MTQGPSPSAGRSLNVALVGCGRWGAVIAKALGETSDLRLAWVCDPRVSWPGAAWAPRLTERVCCEVDAVLVATPPRAHVEPAELALRCGKAVFVEKPFVQSLKEVARLERARRGQVVMVGHLLLHSPLHQRLGQRVRALATEATQRVRIEVVRTSPAQDQQRCPWWTLAPHDLALLTAWFGVPANVRVRSVPDGVACRLTWQNVTADLGYSTRAEHKRREWTVRCGSDEIKLDEVTARAFGLDGEAVTTSPLHAELSHFARCVRTGEEPLTGFEAGRNSVALLSVGHRQLRGASHHAKYPSTSPVPLPT